MTWIKKIRFCPQKIVTQIMFLFVLSCVFSGDFSSRLIPNCNEVILKYCLFKNMFSGTSNGGAVSITIDSSIVNVENCFFDNCKTSNSYVGGGIYIKNSTLINAKYLCGHKCSSKEGHFILFCLKSGRSDVNMTSAAFCPKLSDGTHQTIRQEYFLNYFIDINVSFCYMTGHALLISLYSSKIYAGFCSLTSSKTGMIVETKLSQGELFNMNVVNNSMNSENYFSIFHFNQGTYTLSNILFKSNSFNSNIGLLGGATIISGSITILSSSQTTLDMLHILPENCQVLLTLPKRRIPIVFLTLLVQYSLPI